MTSADIQALVLHVSTRKGEWRAKELVGAGTPKQKTAIVTRMVQTGLVELVKKNNLGNIYRTTHCLQKKALLQEIAHGHKPLPPIILNRRARRDSPTQAHNFSEASDKLAALLGYRLPERKPKGHQYQARHPTEPNSNHDYPLSGGTQLEAAS